MLTISFNLREVKNGSYICKLVAEENKIIIHEDKLDTIKKDALFSVRKKVINLNGKNLMFALNIVKSPKDPKKKVSRNKKVKTQGNNKLKKSGK